MLRQAEGSHRHWQQQPLKAEEGNGEEEEERLLVEAREQAEVGESEELASTPATRPEPCGITIMAGAAACHRRSPAAPPAGGGAARSPSTNKEMCE